MRPPTTFKCGVILIGSSWWKVKVKGEGQDDDTAVGLVPAAYVEQVNPTKFNVLVTKAEALVDLGRPYLGGQSIVRL